MEYAFLDNAFPASVSGSLEISGSIPMPPTIDSRTPVHFKESMKEISLFRRTAKDSDG
jgi:hypothetical protein